MNIVITMPKFLTDVTKQAETLKKQAEARTRQWHKEHDAKKLTRDLNLLNNTFKGTVATKLRPQGSQCYKDIETACDALIAAYHAKYPEMSIDAIRLQRPSLILISQMAKPIDPQVAVAKKMKYVTYASQGLGIATKLWVAAILTTCAAAGAGHGLYVWFNYIITIGHHIR